MFRGVFWVSVVFKVGVGMVEFLVSVFLRMRVIDILILAFELVLRRFFGVALILRRFREVVVMF